MAKCVFLGLEALSEAFEAQVEFLASLTLETHASNRENLTLGTLMLMDGGFSSLKAYQEDEERCVVTELIGIVDFP
jgi:hypothetical protein